MYNEDKQTLKIWKRILLGENKHERDVIKMALAIMICFYAAAIIVAQLLKPF